MKTVVVTNCTSRKRISALQKIKHRELPINSLETQAAAWVQRLRCGLGQMPVEDLYVGRSVVEAARSARSAGAELMFASAGLGLVGARERWPSYELTVSGGEGSVSPMLHRLGATRCEWWSTLNAAMGKPRALLQLLGDFDLILLAMPATYLRMVASELEELVAHAPSSLRVFTSAEGCRALKGEVRRCVMPYDDRLEGLLAGTRNDFPQRAMRHFVETIEGHDMALERGRKTVEEAMASSRAREVPTRRRLADAEICELLRANWQRLSGQTTKLLRHLRDGEGVACEQHRFSMLCATVRAEIQQKVPHGH